MKLSTFDIHLGDSSYHRTGVGWLFGVGISGSPAARQRNFTSTTSLFSLKSILVLLFRTSSRLERRAHSWFAAERAASLADAVPPCDVRADTV